mmetsp:Transcript_7412/g.9012  ORF Transcript_7412/g.9012 Transcript_7412/m.9012 type:complete len:115 (+) Transcript_7412:251-595(+)
MPASQDDGELWVAQCLRRQLLRGKLVQVNNLQDAKTASFISLRSFIRGKCDSEVAGLIDKAKSSLHLRLRTDSRDHQSAFTGLANFLFWSCESQWLPHGAWSQREPCWHAALKT